MAESEIVRRPPCPWCDDLFGWAVARGPAGLADRVGQLLELAAGDDFDQVRDRRDRSGEWVPWSSVQREDIPGTVMNGPYPPVPAVTSAIAVACRHCRTEFRQAWVFERGYESWTIRVS